MQRDVHIRKPVKDIQNLLKTEHSPEMIHKLRVKLKQVNALVRMLEASTHIKLKNHLKFIRRLFDHSGKLRTIQIEKDLIRSYGIRAEKSDYLNALEARQIRVQNKFEKLIRSGTDRKLKQNRKEILSILHQLSNKKIERYLNKEAVKMKRMVQEIISKEDKLHIVRKQLKTFLYNIKLKVDEKATGNLSKFLELLGAWHDRQVAVAQLTQAIYVDDIDDSQIIRLSMIRHELTTDKEKLFDQILSMYQTHKANLFKLE
jgi:CHAD domain-containing protein